MYRLLKDKGHQDKAVKVSAICIFAVILFLPVWSVCVVTFTQTPFCTNELYLPWLSTNRRGSEETERALLHTIEFSTKYLYVPVVKDEENYKCMYLHTMCKKILYFINEKRKRSHCSREGETHHLKICHLSSSILHSTIGSFVFCCIYKICGNTVKLNL